MSIPAAVAFLAYVAAVASLGFLPLRRPAGRLLMRKFVHMGTGVALVGLTYGVTSDTLLVLLGAGTFYAFLSYRVKRFNAVHLTSPGSFGTLFYPVGLLAAFLLLRDRPMDYFRIAVLLLSVSDTVASFGTFRRRGNPRFSLPTEEKSLWGTVGFAVTAFLIFRIFLPGPPDRDLSYLLVAVAVAINLEIFSHRGSDNLSIPVGTALFLRFTVDGLNRPAALLAIIVIVGIGSVLIHRLGILTKLGSMTAYGLGLYYFAVLGYRWLLPVAAFFASSVLFTRIHSRMEHIDPRSGGRNAWQVLANIAVATASSAAFLASGETFWRYGFIAAVAAVTADTWASEIGPMVHRRSFSLAHGQLRESGVSGGLSPAGTLAAVAGSFGISWIALALFSESADAGLILALTASGVLASLVDSVLGAFVEPRLEQWTFFLGRHGPDRISPNDAVNFLASLSALLFFRLLRPLIG